MNVQKIRKDFPVLRENDLIYLDNACMTLRPEQVWEEMERYYKNFPGCPGRSHHRLSERATEAVENGREKVADFLGAKKKGEIIFTRNTTEAINLVANSLDLDRNDEVVTSDREHNSNLLPWQKLEERKGVKHVIAESKENSEFSMDDFKDKLSEKTELVSVVHTSNLDGYTLPVEKITEMAHEKDALVLVDGAQSAPHKPI
ncbi:MAG: aminotransferase class V-fold PLP-dependent enzyme, partial [Candidatus Aenigmatarchaeota archaeon]